MLITYPKLLISLFFSSILMLFSCSSEQSSEGASLPISKDQVIEIAIQKYQSTAQKYSPVQGFPRNIENNQWKLTNWKSWTDGFFAGILWQLSIVDDSISEQAAQWTLPLQDYANMSSHDVGFIINNSFGKAYRVTGDPQYLPVFESAANTLNSRYNNNIKAIRSWDFGDYQFPVIMDNMMNLALLFDATKTLSSEPYYSVALAHATTTSNSHVREDGSSFHLVDFDISTGEVLNKTTVQGFNKDSTWSRGQAWGIYGFTLAFIESDKEEYLQTAQKMADYFIKNLPDDYIPYWDFNLNDTSEVKDSSAAAIAASGLWMLSKVSNDEQLVQKFKAASLNIVDSLLTTKYLNTSSEFPALLLHATGNKPANKEVDTSLVYADYYFIEVLLMQLGHIELPL